MKMDSLAMMRLISNFEAVQGIITETIPPRCMCRYYWF